jgi:uncharacterized membrane protein YgcG
LRLPIVCIILLLLLKCSCSWFEWDEQQRHNSFGPLRAVAASRLLQQQQQHEQISAAGVYPSAAHRAIAAHLAHQRARAVIVAAAAGAARDDDYPSVRLFEAIGKLKRDVSAWWAALLQQPDDLERAKAQAAQAKRVRVTEEIEEAASRIRPGAHVSAAIRRMQVHHDLVHRYVSPKAVQTEAAFVYGRGGVSLFWPFILVALMFVCCGAAIWSVFKRKKEQDRLVEEAEARRRATAPWMQQPPPPPGTEMVPPQRYSPRPTGAGSQTPWDPRDVERVPPHEQRQQQYPPPPYSTSTQGQQPPYGAYPTQSYTPYNPQTQQHPPQQGGGMMSRLGGLGGLGGMAASGLGGLALGSLLGGGLGGHGLGGFGGGGYPMGGGYGGGGYDDGGGMMPGEFAAESGPPMVSKEQ